LACRFSRDEALSDASAATSWSAEGASSGQATDLGAEDIQYDNMDRSAKPGPGGAAFVVAVQTAEVCDGDDPAIARRLRCSRDRRILV
jgi:hypothetical protein